MLKYRCTDLHTSTGFIDGFVPDDTRMRPQRASCTRAFQSKLSQNGYGVRELYVAGYTCRHTSVCSYVSCSLVKCLWPVKCKGFDTDSTLIRQEFDKYSASPQIRHKTKHPHENKDPNKLMCTESAILWNNQTEKKSIVAEQINQKQVLTPTYPREAARCLN